MSFHQAIVGALYAFALPVEVEDAEGIVLAVMAGRAAAQDEARAAIQDARAALDAQKESVARATEELWKTIAERTGVDADDLERLIGFADRHASSARAQHDRLQKNAELVLRRMMAAGAIGDAEGDAAIAVAHEAEGIAAEYTNLFVRFYYELLAMRAEISSELTGKPTSNIDELLSFIND